MKELTLPFNQFQFLTNIRDVLRPFTMEAVTAKRKVLSISKSIDFENW